MNEGHRRTLQLQRGVIDLETGEFPLILASNGEASDGHIIDVAHMEVAERIPMFSNHNADPMQRMGGLINPRVSGKTTQKGRAFLHMVGVLDMAGDGALPDIRRDVAQGISLGDITQMSLRWDDLETPVPRASLDKKHFAFSEAGAESWNTPLFFGNTQAREGSIVGLGSDQASIVGRSRDLSKPSHVREFYEILSRGGDPEQLADDLCAVCSARELDMQEPSAEETVRRFYSLPVEARQLSQADAAEIVEAQADALLIPFERGGIADQLRQEMANELSETAAERLDAEMTNERPEEARAKDKPAAEQPTPEDAKAKDTPAREQPALDPDSRALLELLESTDLSRGIPGDVDLASLLGTNTLSESTLSMIDEVERKAAGKTLLSAAKTIREVDYAKLGKIP